jgi:hypothetical protein
MASRWLGLSRWKRIDLSRDELIAVENFFEELKAKVKRTDDR